KDVLTGINIFGLNIPFIFIYILIITVLVVFSRMGKVYFVSNLFVYGLWIHIALQYFGIEIFIGLDIRIGGIIFLLIAAGLLLGRRSVVLLSILSFILLTSVYFVSITNFNISDNFTSIVAREFFDSITILTILLLFLYEFDKRRDLEKILVTSRNMFRTVLDNIPHQVYWKDTGAKYMGCNINFAGSVGLNNPADILGKTDMDIFFKKEDAERNTINDKNIIENRQAQLKKLEPRLSPSGEQKWIETNKIPLMDESENIIGMVGTIEDVTERKNTEDALIEAGHSYRTLARNLPGMVFRIHLKENNRMELFNSMLFPMTGYFEEEIELEHPCLIDNLIFPEDRKEILQTSLNAVKNNKPFVAEYRLKHKNGNTRYFIEHGRPVYGEGNESLYIDGVILDISEIRRTEEALLETENKFRELFNKANDAIFLWQLTEDNMPGTCIEVNDIACNMLGYSREEFSLMTMMDITEEEPERRINEVMKKLLKKGNITYEINHVAKGGHEIPVEINSHIFTLDGQRVILSVSRDIRERKKSEELLSIAEEMYLEQLEETVEQRTQELTRKENELKALLDNLPDIAWLKDLESRFILVNEPFARSSGFSTDDLKGKTDLDIWPKEVADKYREDDKSVIDSGKTIVAEEPLIDKNNNQLVIETIKSPIYDDEDNIIGTVGIARDITERKKAETELEVYRDQLEELVKLRTNELEKMNIKLQKDIEEREKAERALTESEEQYRELVEKAGISISVNDQNGNLTYINEKFADLLGYKIDELLGKSIATLIYQEDTKFVLNYSNQRIEGEAVPSRYEFRGLKKNGEVIFLEVDASVIKEENEIIGTRAYLWDITERKRSEVERKKLEEQFLQAQKMESMGKLAGAVAHDLNHILTGLVTYPDLILLDMKKSDPLQKKIKAIKKSGQRAANIVEDLLNIARGGVHSEEITNINSVIKDCIASPEINQIIKTNPKISIDSNLEKTIKNVTLSKVQIIKVLYNLINNAGEAMPDGGRILVTTSNKQLKKEIRGYEIILPDKYVTLSVSDTGTGISEDDLPKIFEPYFTKKVMGRSGSGIGLSVVWNIIKEHDGFIDVKSEPGTGTIFNVYLPVAKGKKKTKKKVRKIKDIIGSKEIVVIVDDDRNMRDSGEKILEILNYTPVSFSKGEDAIKYMENNKIDIVLLDMLLGSGLDGLQTYKEMIKIVPDQKALIVSGFSASKRIKETQKLGAGKFIKKPFTIEELGSAIYEELKKDDPKN
ncbi:PAS domain S-box protein, partial [candidate division KSB1 bacterium]